MPVKRVDLLPLPLSPPGQEVPGTLSVYGVPGSHEEIFHVGSLEGRSWGGASYTLPPGMYGVWGTRDGIWLEAYASVAYANFATRTLVKEKNLQTGGTEITAVTLVEDEPLPFGGDIIVPAGRIITLEHTLYSTSFVVGPPQNLTATRVRLLSIFLRAKMDGGAATDYLFLPGPEASTGYRTYQEVKIRCTWVATGMAAKTWNDLATYTFSRGMGIRLLSHDVHLPPVLEEVSLVKDDPDPEKGKDAEGGTGSDPGGGGGNEPGWEPSPVTPPAA